MRAHHSFTTRARQEGSAEKLRSFLAFLSSVLLEAKDPAVRRSLVGEAEQEAIAVLRGEDWDGTEHIHEDAPKRT